MPTYSSSSGKQKPHLTPSVNSEFRVLLVLKDDASRAKTKSMLMHSGFSRIIEMKALKEAEEYIRTNNANLVIIDFILEDGNAVSLLHEARKISRFTELPFLFVVSQTNVTELQANGAPYCGFVGAPYSPVQLQQAISEVMSEQITLVPAGERTYRMEEEPQPQLAICDEPPVVDGEQKIPKITLPGFEKLRVLLIDDNKVQRYQIKDTLHSLGFEDVTDIESGLAALKRIETGRVDYVLSEYYPEGLTGLELLRAVRANPISNSLPFVLFTGHADRDQVLRALRLKVDDYLIKPVTVSSIADSFNRVLFQEEENRKASRTYKGICLDDEHALATAANIVRAAYGHAESCPKELTEMRILLVDEDEKFRRICGSLLRRMGFPKVTETSSGAAALKKAENGLVDMVFCDWTVSQVSGLEVLRNIRSIDFLKTVPFIMLTEVCTRDSVVESLRAGVSDFVAKPCSVETLAEAVARILTAAQSETAVP